jgi:hypothetical protein
VQSPHLIRRLLSAALALLVLAACKREPAEPAGVISREKFVQANVALRTLPDTAPQAQRDATLKKARVTDRQLRAWVVAWSRRPEEMAKVWEEIAFKTDSISGARPMPGGGPPPPPSVLGGVPVDLPPGIDTLGRMGRPASHDSIRARRPRRPVALPNRERTLPKAPDVQQ